MLVAADICRLTVIVWFEDIEMFDGSGTAEPPDGVPTVESLTVSENPLKLVKVTLVKVEWPAWIVNDD